MKSIDTLFRSGDWVEVKRADEIEQTLDADGTLESIPFMPEMMEFCGRRFRVARPAQKSCVEHIPGWYQVREFQKEDVVLLDGVRCSGASHDGCQRLCMIFWGLWESLGSTPVNRGE